MPGLNNKPLTGYLETEYSSEWPGLVTNLPTSRIPPGACSACQAMTVRGRLNPQPAVYPVTGTGGLTVTMPSFAVGENVCAKANLQIPGAQQGFTVIITNIGVYSDYIGIGPVLPSKTFGLVYTFPTPYPRYARFGTKVIDNTLYFSSGSLLGVYALRPVYQVQSAIVTQPGGYFTSTPTVVFSDGGGTGANATATVSGGNLTAVTVGLNGNNYVSPPLINLVGGSTAGPAPGQTTATAVAILFPNPQNYIVQEVSALTGVAYVNTSAGSGYVNPTVAFTGGGGTGASATAILDGSGGIAAVSMNSPGNNYTSAPTVTIIDSHGFGASATATLFTGKPFIGGDFMTSIAQRLVLGNIIGGDGNNTVPLLDLKLTNPGAGYTSPTTPPQVDIVGGGGQGAIGYTTTSSIGGFDAVNGIFLGSQAQFTGDLHSNTSITNISSSTGIQQGQTIIGADIPPATTITGVSGSSLAISANATATVVGESLASYGFVYPDAGNGYSSTPTVNITSDIGGGATAIAQLSNVPEKNSSSTKYPYRVAWSAPNAFGSFDENYSLAPGGFDDLAEAAGLVSSLNVVESVCFVGHNGGVTEMTPNTTSADVPFSFYPIWGGDQGQLVRYGSMAQYGTTLAFLAQDTAYTLTPNGLQEIGGNIANLLQNVALWNDGSYPLQGLYGSIVLIEGEKHYLIVITSDTYKAALPNTFRSTTVYDYNMNQNNWHSWTWPGITITDPIFQSFDFTPSTPTTGNGLQIARDSWILTSWTLSVGFSLVEQSAVYEIAPLTRSIQLLSLFVSPINTEVFNYQFRTEAPSIARMQSERRILIEYENIPQLVTLSITPALNLQYNGQEDPTTQTGTVAQFNTQIQQSMNHLNSGVINGQVLTLQSDFGTFTGVCTSLNISRSANANALFSLVRITGISDLPKGIVP